LRYVRNEPAFPPMPNGFIDGLMNGGRAAAILGRTQRVARSR
jgi:hypothetical protein